jgi:hypothetical protein
MTVKASLGNFVNLGLDLQTETWLARLADVPRFAEVPREWTRDETGG